MTGIRHGRQMGRLFHLGLLCGTLLVLLVGLAPGRDEPKASADKAVLVKPHETSLTTSQEFFAGSPAALRCEVYGVVSLTKTNPHAGADVLVRLRAKDGKEHVLAKERTGTDGFAALRFRVPTVPAGTYKLIVQTKSSKGEERLERDVRIKSDPKILLVSDKPIYQPGQLIHLRALALQAFNLTALGRAGIVFEVEDPKGNKIFKRSIKTSDFGVASIDFQLADEVNLGDYRIRAILGDHQADKTVNVQRYVLPKFKVEVTADKKFYLPKETIQGELQSDYFFGKPVANSKVKVVASTFDVQFRAFQTWEGKTDANGHARFEIKLPDYFVGQPLQQGNALVRLEVKVTDTAEHGETVNRTYPVSEQPIRLSLIPEGGRLVPGVENRVFVAAIYPDGSAVPACDVEIWLGKEAKNHPLARLKTSGSGLGEFRLIPRQEEFRQGEMVQHTTELLGGQQVQAFGPKTILDVRARATDGKGGIAEASAAINSDSFGENVLLRLDKAIYRGGDSVHIEMRTTAGMPTAYVDVIRNGQAVLSRWLDVKDSKASCKLDLPAELFGTLEVHAYQVLSSGEIVRDSRVIYVHPREDLRIVVQPDKDVYLPGEAGRIRFHVTDKDGKPTAAALGVIVVDESVYALQDLHPGLEKVYFTLQEELLKPQVQVVPQPLPPGVPGARPGRVEVVGDGPGVVAPYRPQESVDGLVRQSELSGEKQQIAEVLLTAVKPKVSPRWEISPSLGRRQLFQGQLQQIGWSIYGYASSNPSFMELDKRTGKWHYRPSLLQDMVKGRHLDAAALKDPFGKPLTLPDLAANDKTLAVNRIAEAMTLQRMQMLYWGIVQVSQQNQSEWFKDGRWNYPDSALTAALQLQRQGMKDLLDPWGTAIKLVKRDRKQDDPSGLSQFHYHDLVSAGPDRKFGSGDDVSWITSNDPRQVSIRGFGQDWRALRGFGMRNGGFGGGGFAGGGMGAMDGARFALPAGGGGPGGMPAPGLTVLRAAMPQDEREGASLPQSSSGAATPTHVREYFPETLLWQPALITDDHGRADMPVTFADSITTWRLTASASSRDGALGGATTALRVFQDFFVDLDLPVSLTQNDEVAFPVAVYNYLKTPQTVKLDLQPEPWFELIDSGGLSRSLALKPGEVTSVRFRIKARRLGSQPLTVKATGSKMSDAIKRSVDILPDGQRHEKVASDRLTGRVLQTIHIPENAIPESYKLLVKLYPGVMSQVLEGTEGMLRMPCGCFEQTSSSAYPNILIVDYIKKARVASPQLLMKSEQYLNVGYQRLLTFERPGGGFDWWGSGEPLVWLSAYGLMEFADMAKVYPIDRGIITRTQAWLMKQQDKDSTWSKIGATHGETIERMGDPKLLLTSYVSWALLESGERGPQVEKAIGYIRNHLKDGGDNVYVLALAANALAAWDPKDDSTLELLRKLETLKQDKPEWKAACFPAKGQSLSYAHGDCIVVESTALTALAMLKAGQFTNSVNQALAYLVKTKNGSGTWGSTQATILALKALVAGQGGMQHKGRTPFTVLVNGKEAAKGEVTEANGDVLQLFDLKDHAKIGANEVAVQAAGETNLMYQVVSRWFEPHTKQPRTEKSPLTVNVEYDRTQLTTSDLLRAKATLRYQGDIPTYMMIVDLGIPPGFTADAGDFAEMVGQKRVQKFTMTARQITLYLGDVKPGDVKTFEYTLKPKYPIKAKTPATVAYEYNAPSNRAEAAALELTVTAK